MTDINNDLSFTTKEADIEHRRRFAEYYKKNGEAKRAAEEAAKKAAEKGTNLNDTPQAYYAQIDVKEKQIAELERLKALNENIETLLSDFKDYNPDDADAENYMFETLVSMLKDAGVQNPGIAATAIMCDLKRSKAQ